MCTHYWFRSVWNKNNVLIGGNDWLYAARFITTMPSRQYFSFVACWNHCTQLYKLNRRYLASSFFGLLCQSINSDPCVYIRDGCQTHNFSKIRVDLDLSFYDWCINGKFAAQQTILNFQKHFPTNARSHSRMYTIRESFHARARCDKHRRHLKRNICTVLKCPMPTTSSQWFAFSPSHP